MPHTFAPSDVAAVAAKLVGKDLNLARLIARDFESDFGGGSGSTVAVRVPGSVKASRRDARDLTTPLAQSTIVEQTIPVTLDELVYSNVPLAVGHYDLDLADFGQQVLRPQARAIAVDVETQVVAALQATPETTSLTYDASNPARIFTAIRRQLRSAGVQADESLFAAVGAGVYADLLDSDADVEADQFVKARGFQIHESTRLADDEIVAFCRPAFALVVRAPSVPDGVPFGATIREDDFALTALQAFSTETASNRSIVEALVAVQAMPLAVDREDGTVDLIDNAGAVRVLTAA
jgi:hypothetical protein